MPGDLPFDPPQAINALVWMLLRATLLAALAMRLRLPYASALVLGGLLVEETHLVGVPQLDPRILLLVFRRRRRMTSGKTHVLDAAR